MNERIRELAEQAGITTNLDTDFYEKDMNKWIDYFSEKFAELIIAECKQASLNEIVRDSDIDAHSDPLLREYLKGNNGGVVDSIVAIQQHFFGVEE